MKLLRKPLPLLDHLKDVVCPEAPVPLTPRERDANLREGNRIRYVPSKPQRYPLRPALDFLNRCERIGSTRFGRTGEYQRFLLNTHFDLFGVYPEPKTALHVVKMRCAYRLQREGYRLAGIPIPPTIRKNHEVLMRFTTSPYSKLSSGVAEVATLLAPQEGGVTMSKVTAVKKAAKTTTAKVAKVAKVATAAATKTLEATATPPAKAAKPAKKAATATATPKPTPAAKVAKVAKAPAAPASNGTPAAARSKRVKIFDAYSACQVIRFLAKRCGADTKGIAKVLEALNVEVAPSTIATVRADELRGFFAKQNNALPAFPKEHSEQLAKLLAAAM